MKLYTEEQVIEFTMNMISQYEFGNKDIWNRELLKESFQYVEPIELPSDEEIEEEAFQVPYNNTDKFYDESFIKGAIWMKNRILNQNK